MPDFGRRWQWNKNCRISGRCRVQSGVCCGAEMVCPHRIQARKTLATKADSASLVCPTSSERSLGSRAPIGLRNTDLHATDVNGSVAWAHNSRYAPQYAPVTFFGSGHNTGETAARPSVRPLPHFPVCSRAPTTRHGTAQVITRDKPKKGNSFASKPLPGVYSPALKPLY